jgi:predicted DNA-binding transcriptional regulator YafY
MPTHRPIPRPKVPKVGRPTGKFTQHRRLDVLREKLEVHAGGLSLEDLAQMLRISTRGVRRYLSELALITELESIEVRPGGAHLWRIKPSERGRAVLLRRTQAYALLAARRVFEPIRGSALFDEIDVALRQVQQVAHRPAARTGARGDVVAEIPLDGRFAYVPHAPRAYANRSEDVDRLFQAVVELAVLRFRYRDAGAEPRADAKDGREAREQRDQREQREQREQRDKGARITSHPYALVLHGGSIVCVAHDVDRDTARAFVFDRMTDFDVAPAERFDLPADFDIADWLHGDFGVGRAARSVKLLVEFEPRAAEGVRARRVHPSQKVGLAPDGRVRMSWTLPESPEILERFRCWVLGFGAAVHVVEPPELADDIAGELRRAAARYGAR